MREDASRIPDGLNLPSFRTHFAAANGKCEHGGGGVLSPLTGEGIVEPGRGWDGSSEKDESTKQSPA